MAMPNPKNTSVLDNAIDLLIVTFQKYSGNKDTLSRSELSGMLTTELGDSRNAQDKEAVDKVMGDLDANNGKEVDFNEFIIFVADIAVTRNNSFVEHNKKAEKKK